LQFARTTHAGLFIIGAARLIRARGPRCCLAFALFCASATSLAESIPADAVIKVCSRSMEFTHIVTTPCKNGRKAQVIDQQNLGPLQLPNTPREAERALEQKTELNGLPPGEPDFHDIDRFTLSCGDDIEYRYFDKFHCEKK